jgi:hypothetical protein
VAQVSGAQGATINSSSVAACSNGSLFCTGFEGTADQINQPWGNGQNAAQFVIADSGPFNAAGNKVLRWKFNQSARLFFQPANPPEKVWVRWYQKYSANYNFRIADHHGFTYCTHGECWASAHMPNGSTDGTTMYGGLQSCEYCGSETSGKFQWYVYKPGKTTIWGE